MKHAALIALALASTPALCADWLTVSGASYHFERQQSNGQRWNEKNPGIGYEHDIGESLVLSVGTYQNSYSKNTTYAAIRWEPIQVGRVKFGAMIGPATGYKYPAMAVATASIEVTDRIGILIVAAPPAEKDGTAFVAISSRLRF